MPIFGKKKKGTETGAEESKRQAVGVKDRITDTEQIQQKGRTFDETITQIPEEQRRILGDLATTLEGRLGTSAARTGTLVDDLVASQQALATQNFERNQLSSILGQAQGIGSLDNTASQELLRRGNQDLLTELANIEARTRFQGEQFRRSGEQQEIGTLLAAIEGSRGAQANRIGTLDELLSSTGTTATTETSELLEELGRIFSGSTEREGDALFEF